jgi:outer membrane lipoprotein-sorting protein
MKARASAAALLAVAVPIAAAAAEGVAEIETCMRANLPSSSSVQIVRLDHVDHSGSTADTKETKIFWKRTPEGLSRVRIQVNSPAKDRGSAYLLRENATGESEVFVYLPEIGKPRRIPPTGFSGTLFGTSFSYEDVKRIQELGGGSASERLPDATVGDVRATVVAVSLSPESTSAYRRLVYYVDAERCVPLKIEFFDRDGELCKRLVADPEQITREGKGWLVRSLVLEDLRDESRTELVVEEIEVDAKIRDSVFSHTNLDRRL